MKKATEIKKHYFEVLAKAQPFMWGMPMEIEEHLKEYNAKFDKLVEKELAAECERYYWKDMVQEAKTLAWVLGRDVYKDCEKIYQEHGATKE